MTTSTKSTLTVSAIGAVLSVLVLLGVLHLTADQLAGIGVALTAVFAAIAAWFDKSVPFGKTEPPGE